MSSPPVTPSQAEYWNSPATRIWADEHDRFDRMFAGLTQAVLAAASPQSGEHILDIGCASGTTLIALAEKIGPTGSATGVDISAHSVARAQQRLAERKLPQAKIVLADMAGHPFQPASLDLAFSRFGVMFFTDPVAAFTHLHAALKPDGRIVLAAFRAPAENTWTTSAMAAIAHHLPPTPPPAPDAPGQFAFANPDRVTGILTAAGYNNITLTPHTAPVPLGTAMEAATAAMSFGPIQRATHDAPEGLKTKIREELFTFFKAHEGPEGVSLPGSIWIIQAKK
jgi:SAM-dependent methyltransferase